MHDLRDAYRTLRATPIVSIVAILSLALGIGANTAIFSVVNGVLLRPLPYGSGDRIVSVTPEAPALGPGTVNTSPLEFEDVLHLHQVVLHPHHLGNAGHAARSVRQPVAVHHNVDRARQLLYDHISCRSR